jgi:succinate dehydrogenase flavin-adding protein (antitoxin of CptAB toxin-antitoxin module)
MNKSNESSFDFSVSTRSKRIRKAQHNELVFTGRGRKTKAQQKILIQYFDLYSGEWKESIFEELTSITGFNKRQLNKWFWDRKKKVKEAIKAKKLSYPGMIFQITNTRTGKDLTPSFNQICGKKIFKVEKVTRP